MEEYKIEESVDVDVDTQSIRVKYMNMWTEPMTFEEFKHHYSERFSQVEAVEVREFMTKEDFKQLYPNVIK